LLLERDFTEAVANQVLAELKGHAAHGSHSIDVIAVHGQTVAHHPDDRVTLQLIDPALLAAQVGLPVLSQFRRGDLAQGGQGAPLVPLFHRRIAETLIGDLASGISLHNLGGISNFTYLGAREDNDFALDTGPGNAWIDAATQLASKGKERFDDGGRRAKRGQVDPKAVERLMKHPYFKRGIPKSTGRDDFPFAWFRKTLGTRVAGNDAVATATALTGRSIAEAYDRFVLSRGLPLRNLVLCGGGAFNVALVQDIRARMGHVCRVSTLEEWGGDSSLIEAQAFAYLGALSLLGKQLGGAWTGRPANSGYAPPASITLGAAHDLSALFETGTHAP